MKILFEKKWILLNAGALVLLLFALLILVELLDSDEGNVVRAIKPFDSPATARLDREMARLLDILDVLDRGGDVDGARCERCAYLAQTAISYRDRVTVALADIRKLESTLSQGVDADVPGVSKALERRLADRQSTAGRALAGLKSFTDAASFCESEKLCTRDDPQRIAQSRPLDCSRDRATVRGATLQISTLADLVIEQARLCQALACPVMDCERSAALAADLEIAEISLAELAGGRTALPGMGPSGSSSGLATMLGGVERALVRLAVDSAETSLTPDALSERAHDMRSGLSGWVEDTELRRGVEKDSWRVSALMGEIDVAAEWALRGDTVEYTRAYFAALSRAMLSAARLDAALATTEEGTDGDGRSAAGPVCGALEIGPIYLKVGQARAALGYCRAKSACNAPMSRFGSRAGSRGALRSASDHEIGALAAVIGALPLGSDRNADARVTSSGSPSITLNRPTYLAGEIVRVVADTSPSACLASGGSIGLARAGTSSAVEQRYQLSGNTSSDLLLAAPSDPGAYVLRVFASPDRGGHVLSEHGLNVEPLGPGCDGFTGLWDTQFGRLAMVDRGGQITGSYRRSDKAVLPGLIVGERSGKTLRGTWLSELGRGGTNLRLADSGTSFRGTWGVSLDVVSGGGSWNGDCLGQ